MTMAIDESALDIAEVQKSLTRRGLKGWLLYDFRGLNEVARQLFGLHAHHITRRWFYYIPDSGNPVQLAHQIEKTNIPKLAGETRFYGGLQTLRERLRELLPSNGPVAMEYSPMNDVPTVSFVDGGTLELIRSFNVSVVTSAELIQEFLARWTPEQLQTHKTAASVLYNLQQQAFKLIEKALKSNQRINEYEVQQFILSGMADQGCITDSAPIVAVNANASNPHYAPSLETHSAIQRGDVILIDLWCKQDRPGAVFGDITWMGYAGKQAPAKVQEVFTLVRDARDLAVSFIKSNFGKGAPLQGYRVDEQVRQYITQGGYGEYFFHRTGHSLGTEIHSRGVNIDSFETRDSRELVPGLAFSIEPGVYLPEFGIRSEINVYMGANGPEVHTEPQKELVLLDV